MREHKVLKSLYRFFSTSSLDLKGIFSLRGILKTTAVASIVPLASLSAFAAGTDSENPANVLNNHQADEEIVIVKPSYNIKNTLSENDLSLSLNSDSGNSENELLLNNKALLAGNSPAWEKITRDTKSDKNRDVITEYSILGGETLTSIAEKFGLNVETLLYEKDFNELVRPGDTIRIPIADGVIHTVATDESLSGIAEKYHVDTTSNILEDNGLSDETIQEGKTLFIRGGRKDKPAPTPEETTDQRSESYSDNGNSGYSAPQTTGTFIHPFPGGYYVRGLSSYHFGIDYAGDYGSNILASDGGLVVNASYGYNGGFGNMVEIDHGNGFKTLYGHLSSINVSYGQYVGQGEVIGLCGSTGNSTGPHLHWEMRQNGRIVSGDSYL